MIKAPPAAVRRWVARASTADLLADRARVGLLANMREETTDAGEVVMAHDGLIYIDAIIYINEELCRRNGAAR